jgi:hypothetical protein
LDNALTDGEFPVMDQLQWFDPEVGNSGQRGRVCLNGLQKVFKDFSLSLDFQFHPLRGIGHIAGQASDSGLLVDKRAESHPLNDSLNKNSISFFHKFLKKDRSRFKVLCSAKPIFLLFVVHPQVGHEVLKQYFFKE